MAQKGQCLPVRFRVGGLARKRRPPDIVVRSAVRAPGRRGARPATAVRTARHRRAHGVRIRDPDAREATNSPLTVVISPGDELSVQLGHDPEYFDHPA
ncbi:hypothetical protein GCM10010510_25030 [Streptomyces anandii JCM 4720]|nr:hypothetical protein GCM10010510_25030 [Streptomyces anandii JCM 4720]